MCNFKQFFRLTILTLTLCLSAPAYAIVQTHTIISLPQNIDNQQFTNRAHFKTDALTEKEKDVSSLVKRRLFHFKLFKMLLHPDKKLDGMAVLGFVVSIVSIFYAGIIFGLLGMILCGISAKRVQRNSKTREGKVLAEIGFIISMIGFFGALYIILNINLF